MQSSLCSPPLLKLRITPLLLFQLHDPALLRVKMHYFYKIFFSTLGHDSDKLSNRNDGQGKVYLHCKCHFPPGQGFLCLGMAML